MIAMDKLIFSLVSFYVGFASCQYEQSRGGYQSPNQPPSNILLHKQALGQDGSFNYAFAADNGLQQGEVINPDGSRKGSYSYVDPNGKTVTLSYTAGKDGFRILSGDHLPKAPESPNHRPAYPQQLPRPQGHTYPQASPPGAPEYPLFRPNPIPLEAYRTAPNAPTFRGNPAPPNEEPYKQSQPSLSLYRAPVPFRHPAQPPHPYKPVPLPYQPPQYSVQEGNRERPSHYLSQQYQEDPRKPHSFGNGYSFEFSG